MTPSLLFLLLVALLATPSAAAEEGATLKTSWGVPDLRGTWDFSTMTPFERPEVFADKEFLTAEEIQEFEERVRAARARGGSSEGQADVDVGYNAGWLELGNSMTGTMRTSLVVDPPNGRIPARTEDAIRRFYENLALWGRPPEGPEDRNPFTRCILGFNGGPPMTPGAYNNFVEIVQSPGTVALVTEMINDHRIISIDSGPGGPHLPEHIRLWKGDSRGYWEGDSLVVVTKNFTEHTNIRGSSESAVLTERFTRVSEQGLLYEFTVVDPQSFEAPWTAAVEMRSTTDPLLEYACHEGNRAMTLMLSGARIQEAEGKDNKDWLATWYGGAAAVEAAKKKLAEEAGVSDPPP